jgi:hypothetical protein
MESIEHRLEQLEKSVRTWRLLSLGSLGLLLPALIGAGWYTQSGQLRAKSLIIEDAEGRARIVMGAPIPSNSGRKRTDDAVGIIVLNEQGYDRVSIGAPTPNPQSEGKVVPRIADAAGIEIHDQEGNERGGFGYLDNGSVTFGMDYKGGGEGVNLFVDDRFAGILIHSKTTRERGGLVYDNVDERSVFKLGTSGGPESVFWNVQKTGKVELRTRKEGTNEWYDLMERIRP